MNWQDITAIVIAIVCGIFALRMFYKSIFTKKSGCGCEKCPSGKKTQSIQITNQPPIHKHNLN